MPITIITVQRPEDLSDHTLPIGFIVLQEDALGTVITCGGVQTELSL
jgi:hypothetical protein